jgi:HD-GYP domain-containing protein (c-di-GMP phosphodiesterase class II)
MQHSLAVTALGLALGLRVMRRYGWVDYDGRRRFDSVESRLSLLGVGLLLHDIGKLAVPLEIIHKEGPLTAQEWRAMRAHPELGYQMLKESNGISALSRVVVRSHHERWDGSGYPDGKRGDQIHQFARIGAVADVFDALTSDRTYRPAMPIWQAYQFVLEHIASQFDPEVVDVFRSSVAPYPPTTGVVLSDGRRGIVKEVHQAMVDRPIVRIVADASGGAMPPMEIDLAEYPDLAIVSHDAEAILDRQPVAVGDDDD